MAQVSPVRRRMIEAMTVRNMSPATQRSYVSAVSKFSRYFGKSPERLNLEDVRAFQVHLVSTGVSWPGLNPIVCALRFFYGVTLGEADVPERIPYAREPRKLPVVLSADEVVLFLESVSSLKSRAALTTAYAAGLRASEVAGLRVADIDSARGVILVRHGKGGKDRNVMLSAQLLGILRAYWRVARPTIYLFPGRDEEIRRDLSVHRVGIDEHARIDILDTQELRLGHLQQLPVVVLESQLDCLTAIDAVVAGFGTQLIEQRPNHGLVTPQNVGSDCKHLTRVFHSGRRHDSSVHIRQQEGAPRHLTHLIRPHLDADKVWWVVPKEAGGLDRRCPAIPAL